MNKPSTRPAGRGVRFGSWLVLPLALAVGGAIATSAPRQAQGPTFRAGVDLIAVDVQVIDGEGRPMSDLSPNAFSVTIDGRDRRVLSVDRIQHASAATTTDAGERRAIQAGPSATNQWPASGPVARTFLLAFDTGSFSTADARRAAMAGRAFVDRLQPNDVAGVYAYPFGPRVTPTSDRASVRSALDAVTGGTKSLDGQFHLSPAEVIDINSELASLPVRPNAGQAAPRGQLAPSLADNRTETMRRVQLRECGSDSDFQCAQNIEREAMNLALYYEAEVTREINGLGALIGTLADFPGRKTLVVFSGGMPVTDRPGGRPSVGDLARVLGEAAARANASIYALYFDFILSKEFAAETRKYSRNPVSHARESAVMSGFLDQFASTSGGTMIQISVGSGEDALGRILRETSAYYLLGVAPADTDRDGRTHRLKVKVDVRGATVRSRSWVQIPKHSG